MAANLFFVDLYNARACSDNSGSDITFPPMVAGGTASFALRFLEFFNGAYSEKDQDLAALRVAIGPVDARPVSGQFKLKIGSGASTAANTTAFIDYNASRSVIAAALNALSAREDDFSCDEIPGGIAIRRDDGAAQVLSVVSNRLVPVSFGRITGTQIDGEWVYELRLTQAPVAFSDSAARVLPESPQIATVRDGGSDPSNTVFWNEIQSLYVPPNFRGTYQLRYGDYAKTDLLDPADGPAEIEAAINKMLVLADGTVLGTVTVTNPVTNYAHIEFKGDLAGADLAPLVVSVFSAPPGDWTFDLALDRAEMFWALRDVEAITLPFEAEADFYIDPDDHGAGTVTRKLWRSALTVRRPAIWPDMAAVSTVDWLRANPRDYVPFTADQIVTGPQIYSAPIGTGAATEIVVDHGMGTQAIAQIVVRANTAAFDALVEGVDYTATITSDDEVTLEFPTAPAANSLLVYIHSAPEARQWDAHTHTQAQIEGLVDLLDAMGGRLETLETILPSTGPAATNASQPSGIEIELPATKEALFFRGDASAAFTDKGINAAALGRAPMMFPAVHDASVTAFAALPLPAAAADTVWQNTTGQTIDLGRGIYGGKVLDDGFFASDGRALYAVTQSGTSTSYFPAGFERELWRIFVNDKMLRLNRTLDVQFGLATQLANATSNAQWLLVIERGTATSQSTPTTPDTNLENIVWESDPVLSQRLIITQNRQTHSFGARIKRSLVSSVDTITMDTMLYGVWDGADALAPTSANFALRARLINFDTENALASDARGWITYEITAPAGGEDGATAKAVIV